MPTLMHFMDTHKVFSLKSYFFSMDIRFLCEFKNRAIPRFISYIWALFCSSMFKVFLFMEKFKDSRMVDGDFKRNDTDFSTIHSLEDETLKRQALDENGVETERSIFVQSKYQYISGEDAFGFMEKPETKSFTIQEMFLSSNEVEGAVIIEEIGKSCDQFPVSEDKGFYFSFFENKSNHHEHAHETETEDKSKSDIVFDEKEANDQEKTDDVSDTFCCEEILKEKEDSAQYDDEVFSVEETHNIEDMFYEIQLLPENQSLALNSTQVSDTVVDESSSDGRVDGFWISDQFMELVREESDDFGFIELVTPFQSSSVIGEDDLEKHEELEEADEKCEEMKLVDDCPDVVRDQNSSTKSCDSESDDEDEHDIIWEHQNLIKQMKMEMKNSRNIGLPTISEDCETPKIVEDLKPLKIDEKIEHKDRMEVIQKFYKSYAEKMRKLDILNYQTLNAISFLQLKDSEVFMSSKKSSILTTKALALSSLWTKKHRRIFADPALKSISELNRDLEVVYVGQVCLSWEILCWQFEKAKELLEHDRERFPYNQVAGEYQQFQVLLQRFVEDEPFQGPRVQNYVKKRCILRGFLQVPSIRGDCSKEKQEGNEGEKYRISIVKLAEIIKETMQVFWDFVRADKGDSKLSLKVVHETQMDPAEIELFMNVKSELQKKERKLKEIQRSGNCIVKKLQKQHEGRLSHSLFTSLVELKLVSRVLSLPRLKTDHLVWCQKKLSNISVAGRKVSVEPSFSLFPC